ncbi:MAG: Uncharacterized protein XD69_0280 [Clostridia bacterium 62_21]|nr:MAG: Uncharacterized protein XD69_0280 [Clostridia bacterium 62_21]
MEETLRRILDGLKELQQGQEALRKDVAGLQQGQARLEEGFESLRTDVSNLQQGQQALQKQVTRLELRLESEAFDKIKALFDARQVHLDYFAEIRAALARLEDRLESRVENNVLRGRKPAKS